MVEFFIIYFFWYSSGIRIAARSAANSILNWMQKLYRKWAVNAKRKCFRTHSKQTSKKKKQNGCFLNGKQFFLLCFYWFYGVMLNDVCFSSFDILIWKSNPADLIILEVFTFTFIWVAPSFKNKIDEIECEWVFFLFILYKLQVKIYVHYEDILLSRPPPRTKRKFVATSLVIVFRDVDKLMNKSEIESCSNGKDTNSIGEASFTTSGISWSHLDHSILRHYHPIVFHYQI